MSLDTRAFFCGAIMFLIASLKADPPTGARSDVYGNEDIIGVNAAVTLLSNLNVTFFVKSCTFFTCCPVTAGLMAVVYNLAVHLGPYDFKSEASCKQRRSNLERW